MDKPLDEIIKEEKQKSKELRQKQKKNKLPQKKGAQGFRKERENQKPGQAKRKLYITKRVEQSGIRRDNPPKDPSQLRVLNLDFNITESELRVSENLIPIGALFQHWRA